MRRIIDLCGKKLFIFVLAVILGIALLHLSCIKIVWKHDASHNDLLKNSSSTEKISQAEKPDCAPPFHTNLEVYLNRYTLSPEQGAMGHPNLYVWSPNGKLGYTFGVGEEGETQYSARIEYKGTKNGCDYYSITITYPAKNHIASFTKEIIYKGDDIEIWRDSEYRIGIRPGAGKNNSK